MEKEQVSKYEIGSGEKRWFVISVFKAALRSLSDYGIQLPSNREVEDYVAKTKKLPIGWMVLEHLSGIIRGIEFDEIRRDLISQFPNMSETKISRLCLAEIERRYLEIDQDSDRNYAFLDAIIFAEDK